MEIPLTPMTPQKVLSTDVMPDLRAMVIEKGYELHKLCAENGIKHLIVIDQHMNHWHMQSKPMTPYDTEQFWRMINWVVDKLSLGNYGLIFRTLLFMPPPPPQDSSEEWKKG